jgi:8-oxo-dGTP pyrophosphatase MutT (NUDIX family)
MDRPILNPSEIALALRAPAGASSDFDLNPGFRPPQGRRLRAASVLVPLVERGSGMRLVLTRRAALLRHHPGQVAFPGGKQDPGDPTPLAAALREAREEIGVADAAILGELPSHETVTGFVVTPFVGLVAPDFTPTIDRSEVDEVFEVPLDFVLDPANFRVEGRAWQGQVRHYYVVPWGPHYIWGATARMLRTFADRMQAA